MNKENLRTGFTTGACATAAARGALLALIYQRAFSDVTIRLPQGNEVCFPLHTCTFAASEGRASVIKDAGDDPDVTDKAEICALVTWADTPGVQFRRGPGVGLVTKSGLPVPPGEPAINPMPRKMIQETIEDVLADAGARERGVVVEIAVPQGEEMARKTFNPRLGITGGISILGTSGIVTPYSTSAWVASVVQAIDVASAQGCDELVFTVGGRSERTAQKLFQLPEVAFIQIGPFFGDALRHTAKAGAKSLHLVAMIGKLAKFANRNESVHSTVSSQDFAFLARLATAAGTNASVVARVAAANTAQEAAELVNEPRFFALLCEEAWRFATDLVAGKVVIEVILIGIAGDVLGNFPTRHYSDA